MITRLVLRLPWFLSTPLIVSGALALAVLLNILAGTYFERTFLDDADPLAQAAVAAAPPASQAPGAGAGPLTASTSSAAAHVAEPSAVPAAASQPAEAAAEAPPLAAAAAPPAAPVAPARQTGPVLLSEGSIVDGDPGHPARGRARLIRSADGGHTLRFEDFSVVNGPDVFVILSPDPSASRDGATVAGALNLGRLRATNGNVNYQLPAGVDVTGVRSVIIYCRAFHVVMGAARLEAR